jgi:hypothetical protein
MLTLTLDIPTDALIRVVTQAARVAFVLGTLWCVRGLPVLLRELRALRRKEQSYECG